MTAAQKLRELLATRPAGPNTEELQRWWKATGVLLQGSAAFVDTREND